MQDITAETVEYPKNCPYCAEEHLLILWPNAHGAKAFARKMLTSDGLQVTDEVEIQFTKNKILNKITQLYAVDVEKANKRQKITGDGTLTTFVVKDLNPEYRTVWRYGTGYTSTNIKIYKCKQKLREKLGHPFLVHSTNDTTEAKRDFRLILGPRFREDRTIVEESFHTADDILNFLNDVDDYLVLRDYSGGDIDILTRRPASELAHLLKATHSRMRLIEFPREKLLPKIDIVHPHHGIFCPIWCERMLETRVFDSSTNRFRPNNENLTFSLIYHYLLYKESIPQHSQLILRKCIETAGYHELSTLDFANHNQWIYVLSKYLKKNGYSVPQSIDLSLSRNENTRSAIIKLSQLDRVACIPDSNPEYTVQETNNIDKWAHFDLIKIAKLLLKKSIHDQQSVQGVEKGHELLVSPLLERINVPFATKINGERENYLLKIFYSNYAHVIESIESSLRAASRLTDAQLCTPKKIERFNNLILTIEKYIEGKVLAKFFTADYAHALTEIENKLDALTSILVRNAIMHGDIHEKNILVDHQSNLVLIDFKYAFTSMTGLHATINPMKSACINDARSIEILKQKIQNFVSCNTVPTIYNPNVDKFIATEYCKAFNKYAQPRTVKKTIQRGAEHFLKIIIDRSGFTPQSNLNAEESFFFSISTKFGAELEFARGQVDL